MDKYACSLTVLFEDPFWVGIYERQNNCNYEVCKIVFGGEPKDYVVYDFIIKNWINLRFSPAIDTMEISEKRINPKRIHREIQNQLQHTGISTKAQQALSLQREQGKLAHKVRSSEEIALEKQLQFELHQKKRKAKHRGH